ncbi:2-nitropropane dioxygenase [Chytriomyces sp. MP71]|nr:2-nitropropane dioxygenase [Chytriomyces sp. MP71]
MQETVPIVVPPMAYVTTPQLVAKAVQSGCVAFVAAAYFAEAASVVAEMAEVRRLLGHDSDSWGVGFITWHLDALGVAALAALEEVLAHRPPMLWFSFGDASNYISVAKQRNPRVKVFVQIQHESEAPVRANHVDVIVAQGCEAGGHGGASADPLLVLLPRVVQAVQGRALVAAAGGICHGSQLAAVLTLGASYAVMGTRFAASSESAVHPLAKKRMLAASATTRTRVYNRLRNQAWPHMFDFRVLENEATAVEDADDADQESVAERYAHSVSKPIKEDADFNVIAIAAGAGVGLIHEILDVSQIVTKTMLEAKEAFASTSKFFT